MVWWLGGLFVAIRLRAKGRLPGAALPPSAALGRARRPQPPHALFQPPPSITPITSNPPTSPHAPPREIKGVDLPRPFPRLPWADAMGRYGSDKPDTRFGLEFRDVTAAVAGCNFK